MYGQCTQKYDHDHEGDMLRLVAYVTALPFVQLQPDQHRTTTDNCRTRPALIRAIGATWVTGRASREDVNEDELEAEFEGMSNVSCGA